MVKPEKRFLIDAAFIVQRTQKTFFGAPLLTDEGTDRTFAFGCIRDFLRLRRKLGITAGALIVGKEAYSGTSGQNCNDLIAILKGLNIPHVYNPLNRGLQIVSRLRSRCSHIVTADKRFLQLCADDRIVLLPREGRQCEWDYMSSETVTTVMGIAPKDVPSYLALTDAATGAAFTTRTARRLVELYGNIDSIYGNLCQVTSVQTRKKLAECELRIRHCYAESQCDLTVGPIPRSVQNDSLNDLDTASNRQLLR